MAESDPMPQAGLAGPGHPRLTSEALRHPPLSPEYARDYNNGWRASERHLLSDSNQVLTPWERAYQRNVSRAWYDGDQDHADGRSKWTFRQARLAGWDNTGNYLFALYCAQEWAQDLAGLPSYGTDEQQAAAAALSAFQAVPSQANLDAINDAVGPARKAARRPAGPYSSSPDVAEPGNAAGEAPASTLQHGLAAIAADLDARGRAAERDRSAAPRLAANREFTGSAGTPLPVRRGRPPAVTTATAVGQTRPRRRQ